MIWGTLRPLKFKKINFGLEEQPDQYFNLTFDKESQFGLEDEKVSRDPLSDPLSSTKMEISNLKLQGKLDQYSDLKFDCEFKFDCLNA